MYFLGHDAQLPRVVWNESGSFRVLLEHVAQLPRIHRVLFGTDRAVSACHWNDSRSYRVLHGTSRAVTACLGERIAQLPRVVGTIGTGKAEYA